MTQRTIIGGSRRRDRSPRLTVRQIVEKFRAIQAGGSRGGKAARHERQAWLDDAAKQAKASAARRATWAAKKALADGNGVK